MSTANSNRATSRTKADFPLRLHKPSGQWVKQINGKRYYFGKDKKAGLAKLVLSQDHAGRIQFKKNTSTMTNTKCQEVGRRTIAEVRPQL